MLTALQKNSKKRKPTKLSPIKENKAIQALYYKKLKQLVNELKKAVREQIIPKLKDSKITHDAPADILTALEMLRQKFTNIDGFAKSVSNEIVNKINKNNENRFLKGVNAAFGVDLENVINKQGLNDILELQKQKNKVLIKSIPEEFFKQIEVIVSNGIANGVRHEEIARQINGIKGISSTFGKLENRVKMIARNETSSINANLNKARHESVGIKFYEWGTSGDERVRHSHSVMDKKICKYDDPTVYADTIEDAVKGKWKKRSSIGGVEKNAGIDYNCRCVAQAIIPNIDYKEGK